MHTGTVGLLGPCYHAFCCSRADARPCFCSPCLGMFGYLLCGADALKAADVQAKLNPGRRSNTLA